MVEPSLLALTAYSSSPLMITLLTLPRCSFRLASMDWEDMPIFHTLTSPSAPPEIRFLLLRVHAMEVTPWLCASEMT